MFAFIFYGVFMENKPLVSCLMLTYNRFTPFKKAVQCFLDQTYENKELIIVNSGDERYTKKITDHIISILCDDNNIHLYNVDRTSIGNLRNIGLYNSNGEYVMVFDDDDYHHPQRIEKQIAPCLKSNIQGTILRNFKAVYKNRIFPDKVYICTMLPGLEGTLLFKKSDVRYPDMDQGEDTGFLKRLKEASNTILIIDEPYDMYHYNFYGKNTVSKSHFQEMIDDNDPLRSI